MNESMDQWKAAPFRISLQGLKKVINSQHLELAPTSPFGFLLYPTPSLLQATDGSRGAAQAQTSYADSRLSDSIELLAQPDCRLRILRITEDGKPESVNIFVKGGRIAYCYFAETAFFVGSTIESGSFISQLATQISGDFSAAPQNQVFSRSHVRVATALWFGTKTESFQRISVMQVLLGLASLGMGKETSKSTIDEMVRFGCFREHTDGLSLSPMFRYWMDSLWSGPLLYLSHKNLKSGTLEAIAATPKRLLFAGPLGKRTLCTPIAGEKIVNKLNIQSTPVEASLKSETFIHFSHLPLSKAIDVISQLILATETYL